MKTLNETDTKFNGSKRSLHTMGTFIVFLILSFYWVGILFKLMHAVRTPLRWLVWEWTAECREQQCLRVIHISKIQKTWVPEWRSWTHRYGFFPGEIKHALHFLLLTHHHHHQQPKTWNECEWRARRGKYMICQVQALPLFYSTRAWSAWSFHTSIGTHIYSSQPLATTILSSALWIGYCSFHIKWDHGVIFLFWVWLISPA